MAAAVLFSTGGAAIKLAELTGWQVASYRAIVAAVFLWIVLPGARAHINRTTILGSVVYAAMVITFVLANKMTTAANTMLLQSTAPIYLLLIGPVFLKEKLRPVDFLVVAAIIGGAVVLFSGTESRIASAPDPLGGNIVALTSGVAWALTIAVLRWIAKRHPKEESAETVVVLGNTIAFLVGLPMALRGPAPDFRSILVLLYLGLFQIGLAYICFTRSIRHVPAIDASTMLLIETVLTPIWAWMMQGERPSGRAIMGGAMILMATFAGSWFQAKVEVTPEEALSSPPQS
ncbi:MAG TPA: EamA family transporter [Bryobacteraceae bacterium]|nr:EamA family transporter [Bryobacteraceae bacterium]